LITAAAFALLPFFTLPALAVNSGDFAGLRAAAASGGIYTLTGDIYIDGVYTVGAHQAGVVIGSNLTLDLNGFSLTIDLPYLTGEDANGIKIAAGVTLIIMDSNSGANELNVTNRAFLSSTSGNGAAINTTDGALIIQSGTVSATGGSTGAGIGGGAGGAGGVITITGGEVTANGGHGGAGIGGGSGGAGGNITIGGGEVRANGSRGGAGIGGGWYGAGGNIVISGGKVTATGGNISIGDYGAGAGIGSGGGGASASSPAAGSITIAGTATVNATGGNGSDHGGGAGIGSGGSSGGGGGVGNANNIIIENGMMVYTDGTPATLDGEVSAIGGTGNSGRDGAAIGAGGPGSGAGTPLSPIPSTVNIHIITATAGVGGSIAPSGAVLVVQGANQVFTVTANAGYAIDTVTGQTVTNSRQFIFVIPAVSGNQTIEATFIYDATQDNADITAAKATVEGAFPASVAQAFVNTQAEAKTHVQGIIAALSLNGVTPTVVDNTFNAAVAGTPGNFAGTNGSYTFTVNLNKGGGAQQTTATLTLNITATPYDATQDNADITTAKALIEGGAYTVAQATANTDAAVRTWLVSQINALSGMAATGIIVAESDITVSGFTLATAGTAGNPGGTNGAFSFTVTLNKGGGTPQTASASGTITATAFQMLGGSTASIPVMGPAGLVLLVLMLVGLAARRRHQTS